MGAEDQGQRPDREGEGPAPLEGAPPAPPVRAEELARLRDVSFPVGLRGYDRDQVDAYVRRVNRVIAELEVSRTPQSAIRHALEQVGEQTRGVLEQANESAERITAVADARADELIRQAERDAIEIRAESQRRVAHLDAEVESIWQERERLLEDIRQLADRLMEIADEASRRFPAAPAGAPPTAAGPPQADDDPTARLDRDDGDDEGETPDRAW